MHDGMPYGRNQGQGQGHSREVDHQSPMGLIFTSVFQMPNATILFFFLLFPLSIWLHLFRGAGHEKRRGEQLKSVYL